PFSEIQMPPFRPNAIPQGFARFGSVCCAIPGMSDTRLVCMNVVIDTDSADVEYRNVAIAANTPHRTTSMRVPRCELSVFTRILLRGLRTWTGVLQGVARRDYRHELFDVPKDRHERQQSWTARPGYEHGKLSETP